MNDKKMPSNFLIKLFLFIILPILMMVGFFVISAGKSKVVIKNNGEYKNINADSRTENNDTDLAAENIIKQSEEVENVENNNFTKSAEEVKEEVKKENSETSKPKIKIIQNLVSWGHENSSERNIDTIIIHSSYDALGNDPYDMEGLLKEYKIYRVAPHFVIDRKGKIYQLVADKNIAYHAGASQMPDGRNGVNNFSIGIELMNTKEDKYTKNQYEALSELLDYLKNEHKIEYVLGHSQIAPERKTDPWNFDYSRIK